MSERHTPSQRPASSASSTPFVGRESEVQALTQAIEGGARLLTLRGPGGVGKTRIVEEVRERLRDSFRDVVPWVHVSLDDVESLEGFVDRVVDALGGSGAKREDVTKLLAARAPLVLTLDPFDRLVHAAGTLAFWLREVPTLSCVVVTRQALQLPQEVAFDIAPITDEHAAIALFEAIAQRHRAGFVLAPADRAIAAEIVRELDGLPLAIDLAASRMAVMSPAALLHRLRNRFEVLRRTQDGDSRHRALETSIAWSVELLSPLARDALTQCTVFRGGFSLEAAETVVALYGSGTLDALQSLRERSLLDVVPTNSAIDVRLSLGHSVRAFAEARISAADREAAEERHATYFVEHAERWSTENNVTGWSHISADRENLLAVVERILTRSSVSARSADRALRALVAVGPVLLREGALALCANYLERGLAIAKGSGADPRLQARSLELRASVKRRLDDATGAERDYAEAMVLAHHTGEQALEARCCTGVARLALSRGNLEGARNAVERAEALNPTAEDVRRTRGLLWMGSRAWEKARLCFEETLAQARRAQSTAGEIHDLRNLATLDLCTGNIAHAIPRFELALARAESSKDARAIVASQIGLALSLGVATNDAPDATRTSSAIALAEAAAQRAHEHGWAAQTQLARGVLGVIHATQQERGEARLLLNGIVSSISEATLPADLDILFHVALARIEMNAGHHPRAEELIQRARLRAPAAIDEALVTLVAADALASDPASPTHSALTRWLLRIPSQASTSGAETEARKPLTIGTDSMWFRVGSEERVDLSKRKPLRLLLERLAEESARVEPKRLPWEDLLESGWPGEKMRPDAAAHRVRVAISTMRKMGLRDVLRTEEDGYRIDPSFRIVRVR